MRSTRNRFRMGGKHRRLSFTEKRDPYFFRAAAMRRRRWPIVVGVVALAAAITGGVLLWQASHSAEARSRAALERTVDGYLTAWGKGDWAAMQRLILSPAPASFRTVNEQMFDALRVSGARYTSGEIEPAGRSASVPFTARLELTGLGPWTYRGTLQLTRVREQWRVSWSPNTVHPKLKKGLAFGRTRTWPERAPILARDGDALTIQGDVVTIGVVPGRVERDKEVVDALRRYAGVDPKDAKAAIHAPGAKPTWFVPVITLRLHRYEQVRSKLYPVPGIFFRRGRGRILLREGFAQHVVGRVGEITAEQLKALGDPYQVGDIVGRYGLEQAYEEQLAGLPSGKVELRRGDKVVNTLRRFTGRDPQPVQTTLDVDVQQAAEEAVSDTREQVAVVAVDARNGEIRAVVNRPVDGANTALAGHYPPGSTFKVVTGAAVLANGTRLDSPISCPPEVTAGGKVFRNFEGEALGQTTFADAFAHSCNTAFIQMALRLPGDALSEMAATFGFTEPYSLPLPVASTQFPRPVDQADVAASAIGQGRILATPLHMATVAAAAQSGTWRPPTLVSAASGPTPSPPVQPNPLPRGVARNLGTVMRLVVTEGTGTAANVAGQDVRGKTGTAEFGSTTKTHAWFIGFRGRLAFAVLVPGGGVGGGVAAPVAARFVRAL
ncbi:MAG: penicillin-binding transpeptidase domain-containing protein [Actinomycetota bacterium]